MVSGLARELGVRMAGARPPAWAVHNLQTVDPTPPVRPAGQAHFSRGLRATLPQDTRLEVPTMNDPFLPPGARLRVFADSGDRYVTLAAGGFGEASTWDPTDVRRTWWRLVARCWQAWRMAEARAAVVAFEETR